MSLKIIVLVKQVPDTHNITGEAMRPDGTVNRAALPAIFNPEDLNALEEALKVKDKLGGTITVVTMGPPKAAEVLKDCLYRGADDVALVTDRAFAGADTLATSYALKCAIERVGAYDIIFCGRQAIDGDTAQVGPQTAEKLGINQVTCVCEVKDVSAKSITAKRSIEGGYEIVKAKYPVLITVTGDANTPRPPSAKLIMAYKNVKSAKSEEFSEAYMQPADPSKFSIKEWSVETIKADPNQCGLSGSPTKVKKIDSVILTAGEVKQIPNTDAGITDLVHELVHEHIIG